jgi:hypothetical protein
MQQQQQQGPQSHAQLLASAQLWSLGSEGCLLAWPAVITPAGQLKHSSTGSASGGGRGGRGRGGRGAGRGGGSQGGAPPQQQPAGPQPTAVLPKVEAALQAAAAADVGSCSADGGDVQAAIHPGSDDASLRSPAVGAPSDATEQHVDHPSPPAPAAGTAATATRPRQRGSSRQQQGWEQLHITSMVLQPAPGCLLALGGSKGELLVLQPYLGGSAAAASSMQLPGLRVVGQELLEGGALTHLAWSESGVCVHMAYDSPVPHPSD